MLKYNRFRQTLYKFILQAKNNLFYNVPKDFGLISPD